MLAILYNSFCFLILFSASISKCIEKVNEILYKFFPDGATEILKEHVSELIQDGSLPVPDDDEVCKNLIIDENECASSLHDIVRTESSTDISHEENQFPGVYIDDAVLEVSINDSPMKRASFNELLSRSSSSEDPTDSDSEPPVYIPKCDSTTKFRSKYFNGNNHKVISSQCSFIEAIELNNSPILNDNNPTTSTPNKRPPKRALSPDIYQKGSKAPSLMNYNHVKRSSPSLFSSEMDSISFISNSRPGRKVPYTESDDLSKCLLFDFSITIYLSILVFNEN